MKKQEKLRRRLNGADGAVVEWPECGDMPQGRYAAEDVPGIRLSVSTEWGDDFIIVILPGDAGGTYDAWLHRRGGTELVHLLTRRSRDPEGIVKAAVKLLPEYAGSI